MTILREVLEAPFDSPVTCYVSIGDHSPKHFTANSLSRCFTLQCKVLYTTV